MTESDKQEKMVPIESHFPIDLVVELVENRVYKRRQAAFRWGVTVILTLTGVMFGSATLYIEHLFNQRERESVVEGASDRIGSLRDGEPYKNAPQMGLGRTPVRLDTDESAAFALGINTTGKYQIETHESDEDLDPIIYLYRQWPRETEDDQIIVEMIAFDDDSGRGLSALIDVDLDAESTYYLEIEEIFGAEGVIDVTVSTTGE